MTISPLVSTDAVLRLAADEDPAVRTAAGTALAPLVATDPEVRAAVLALARDASWSVRTAAWTALAPLVA